MNKKNGFTLIEIMVVIVILGTLAAVAVPKLFGFSAKAKAAEISTAAGSYIHLQEAFLHTNHTAGTWAEIGYNAPGNGQSSSFVYKDCISSKTTIEKNGASITGWHASNPGTLNSCSANNSWAIVLVPVADNNVNFQQLVSSLDCAALTKNWKIGDIDANACTSASNGNEDENGKNNGNGNGNENGNGNAKKNKN